uniref:Uncharacterized protein n=1 Tax=Oryza brachyantha TaxID=4533 RepID=J3N7R2_ORYBR
MFTLLHETCQKKKNHKKPVPKVKAELQMNKSSDPSESNDLNHCQMRFLYI